MNETLTSTESGSVQGRQLLADIAGMNLDFIRLLQQLSCTITDDRALLSMPSAQAMQLGQLSQTAQRRLARSGVTLFDLRFGDRDFWQSIFDGKEPERYRCTCIDAGQDLVEIQLFILGALLLLRHIAIHNRFVACLGFSVDDTFLDRYLQLESRRLRQIAASCPGLLQSRPHGSDDAWGELMRLARRTDGQPLLPARMLGYQHMEG
ncbi:MAG: hypothetical protein KJO55_07925 [Gammaproteobacteria bacterium]|nr:hypothetical protein [Gammaproteobacteria bacterium]NND59385.1 hypothetical protein [Gammaproteobacteria bacterium]